MLPADLLVSQQRQWDDLRALFTAYASSRPVRRIAVVGNAPLAPDAERAADIDAADLVVRMNSLALDEPGAPPTVGTACHVVLLSRATRMTPWVFRDYRHRAYVVLQTGFTTFHTVREHVAHWPADLGAIPLPNAAVTARIDDRLHPDREPGTVLPTSGTIATFLAREMFTDADVLVTGLSFLDDRDQTEWRHHAGGSTALNPKHDLGREGALLETWVAEGRIRFRN